MTTTVTIFDSALSVARIRHEFHELPVGEALRGPAYGELQKSKGVGMALGVVAAVAVAWTGVGLLASGTILSQVAGGAMVAGGVLSGVGAVTGNKKLTRAGAVLSLAGGVGGLASAYGGTMGGLNAAGSGSESIASFAKNTQGAASSVFGGTSPTAESTAATAPKTTLEAPPPMADAPSSGILNNAGGVDAGSTVNAANPTIGLDDASNIQGGYSQAPAGGNSYLPPAASAPTTSTTTGLGTGEVTITEPAGAATAAGGGSFSAGAAKTGNALLDFAKSDSGGKVLAGILQGASQGAATPEPVGQSAAQEADSLAHANATNTATDILKQQQANMNNSVVLLDPNDPNFAAKQAAALAAGKQVSVLPKYGQLVQNAKTPTATAGA